MQVLLNGATTNDYQLTPINDHYYVQTTSIIASGNVITIKAHSLTGTPSGNGFFEVPLGLQRNSQNKNIKKLTLGDMVKHYNLAVNEHPNFVGTAIGGNNSRDLDDFVRLNSGFLRNILGGNYHRYINRLISLGIIQEYSCPKTIKLKDGTVWKHKGRFSTTLGISKQYRVVLNSSMELEKYTIKDKLLTRNINSLRSKVEKLVDSKEDYHYWIRDYYEVYRHRSREMKQLNCVKNE